MRFDARNAQPSAPFDAPRLGLRRDLLLCRARRAGQQRLVGAQDHDGRGEVARAKTRIEAERDLAARRAAADDRDSWRAVGPSEGVDSAVQLRDEMADRARGERMGAHARQVEPAHRRTDVDAEDVVLDRRAPLERKRMGDGIDVRRRGQDHAGARPAREGDDVDLELVCRVVPRDEARHHARVDGDRAIEHHDQPCIRGRVHRPAPQHLDVRMPATDEHDGSRFRRGPLRTHRVRSVGIRTIGRAVRSWARSPVCSRVRPLSPRLRPCGARRADRCRGPRPWRRSSSSCRRP